MDIWIKEEYNAISFTKDELDWIKANPKIKISREILYGLNHSFMMKKQLIMGIIPDLVKRGI